MKIFFRSSTFFKCLKVSYRSKKLKNIRVTRLIQIKKIPLEIRVNYV